MKFSAIMAASLATANAVTQSMQQIGAGATTETEGHMQETVTNVSYQVDLDSIQAEIEAWYSDVASPFIGDHKDMVYKAALAEMEKKHGALLETCDEGLAVSATSLSSRKRSQRSGSSPSKTSGKPSRAPFSRPALKSRRDGLI